LHQLEELVGLDERALCEEMFKLCVNLVFLYSGEFLETIDGIFGILIAFLANFWRICLFIANYAFEAK